MRTITLILFILLLGQSLAQTEGYVFGGGNDDIGYSFTFNELGGYVLLAAERTAIDSSEQIALSSIDADGNLIWRKVYGDIHHDVPSEIERTSDQGYVVVGSKWDYGYSRSDAYVMKLDGEGNVQWHQYIGGFHRDQGFSIEEVSSGGYILTGFTKSDTLGSFGQMSMIRIDAGGNTIWSKDFGGPGKDYGFSVCEDQDGNFIAVGHYAGFHDYSTFEFTETHSDILIYKLDANGNEVWGGQYGGAENDLGYAVALANDGGYYVLGSTQIPGQSFDVYLLKLDENGVEEWSQTYGGSGFDYGRSISISADGYIYIAGSTNNDPNSNKTDLLVKKLDLNGNEVWSADVGGNESEYGYQVRATADNGCAVIGSTRSTKNKDEDGLFVKFDKDGTIEYLDGSEDLILMLFPNPTSTYLNVYFHQGEDCDENTYEVVSETGQVVYNETVNSKFVKINVANWAGGTYFIRITSPCSDEQRRKFIVHQ